MRLKQYLNEVKKQIWNLSFDEFQKVADLEWSEDENRYIFKWKKSNRSKKAKRLYIPTNDYQVALKKSYGYLIKTFADKVDIDILKSFKDQSWAQKEITKRENPLDYINDLDLASNKEIRQYVKETKEYNDYLNFWKDLSKKAQNEDDFTWNDAKQIAKKSNIKIGSSLLSNAPGEADVGSSRIDIKKKYIGTSDGVSLFFHELAHALLVTKRGKESWSNTKNVKISKTEWKGVFGILSEPSKGKFASSQTERYARLFETYFTMNKRLKRISPGLYNKILGLLEDISIFLVIKNHGGYQYWKELIKNKENET